MTTGILHGSTTASSIVRLARLLMVCILASAASTTAARCGQTIEIKHAWSRATPKGSPIAAGYLTIENQGGEPDRLLGARSDIARKVELHTTSVQNGVTSMKPVDDGLPIPANGSVTLRPGGNHMMFIGLSAPLAEGKQVAIELIFEKAGTMAVDMDIASIGSLTPPAAERSSAPATVETANVSDDDFFTHVCGDRLMANITVSPARPGDFEISVELEDTDEKPLAARAVSITLTDGKHESSPLTANAERITDEKWRVKMSAPTSGTWLLSLNVETSHVGQVDIAAPILIN